MTCVWSRTLFLLLLLIHGGAGFVVVAPVCLRQGDVCGEHVALRNGYFPTPMFAATPRFSPEESSGTELSASKAQSAPEGPLSFQDSVKEFFLNLVRLSLRDYEWRSDVFKEREADRLLEESLARMQGTSRRYVRPMDASEEKIGPLGQWEKSAVEWLSLVIDEEGRRAKKIVSQDGKLVRPIEAADTIENLGPLGFLEKQASDFIQLIRVSEQERARTKTLRPKDLKEDLQGPLGRLESAVSRFFQEIRDSETLRAQQSKLRGGEVVRPIDVPGPLGEWEMKVAELLRAEERRALELDRNKGRVVRPKDAAYKGPLGETEEAIYELFQKVKTEESERLRNIQQLMQERRPMENDRKSVLGLFESTVVGVFRAPQLVYIVFQRVMELLKSEPLIETDREQWRDASSESKGKQT